jgi:hypothetical protein
MLKILACIALMIMATFLLSGCGSGQYVLFKNGQPSKESEFNQDKFKCKQLAAQAHPFAQAIQHGLVPQNKNTGNYSTNCNPAAGTSGGFSCTTTSSPIINNGSWYESSYDQQLLTSMQGSDANQGNRIQFYNDCMAALGYREVYIEQPQGSAEVPNNTLGEIEYKRGATAYVEGNETIAMDAFLNSARLGYANAQYRLGIMYESGDVVEKDTATAKRWFEMAAKQGHQLAAEVLASRFGVGK